MSKNEQYIYDKNLWMVGTTPTSIKSSGKFPVVADQQWKTLEDAINFINDPESTAIPGMILSVVEDTDDNNGIYLVEHLKKENEETASIQPCKITKVANNEFVTNKLTGIQQTVDKVVEKIGGLDGDSINDSVKKLEEKHDEDIKTLKFLSGAQSNWKTEKVGGIDSGKTSEDFKDKSVYEVLDEILYPTLYPRVKSQPSITPKKLTKTLFNVGETIPLKDSFEYTTNRGLITYDSENFKDVVYAGDVIKSDVSIDKGSFGGIFEEGIYTLTYSVSFKDGEKPTNSKGYTIDEDNKVIDSYKGNSEIKSTQTLYGVYPIYISTTSFTNLTEMTLQNYLVGEIKFTGIVSPNETTSLTDKFTIAIPSYLTLKSACVYNNVSGKYDINFFPTVKSTATYNGIEYTVYKRTGDSSNVKQSDKWEVIVNKKS